MYTLVLAGGFGTRLRSLVNNVPKPMAPIWGKPFLEYIILNLKGMGLRKFVFCLHYKADQIKNYFRDGSRWGVEIKYSIEKKPLGTGGAIGLLRNHLVQTFCLVNADTYINLDLNGLMEAHQRKKPAMTMALTKVRDSARYGEVHVDKGNYIISFKEKVNSNETVKYDNEILINAGFYIIEPDIFNYIPKSKPVSLEKEVLPLMINAKEKIMGYKYAQDFFDIGTPEDYLAFQRWVKSKMAAGLF